METIIFGIKLAFGLVIGLMLVCVLLFVLSLILGLIGRVILFFWELFDQPTRTIAKGSSNLDSVPDIIYAKKHETVIYDGKKNN